MIALLELPPKYRSVPASGVDLYSYCFSSEVLSGRGFGTHYDTIKGLGDLAACSSLSHPMALGMGFHEVIASPQLESIPICEPRLFFAAAGFLMKSLIRPIAAAFR